MNAWAAGGLAADLLIGCTALLGAGAVVVACSRAAVQRQRAAELAVVCTLVWLGLAFTPLPRRARARGPAPSVARTFVWAGEEHTGQWLHRATTPDATSSAPFAHRPEGATLRGAEPWPFATVRETATPRSDEALPITSTPGSPTLQPDEPGPLTAWFDGAAARSARSRTLAAFLAPATSRMNTLSLATWLDVGGRRSNESVPFADWLGTATLLRDESSLLEVSRDAFPLPSFERAPDATRRTQPQGALQSDSALPWLHVLLALYIAGGIVVLTNLLLGAVLVRRLLARAEPAPPWLADLFEARRRALGVRRCRLRVTSASRRPVSAGLARPTVLLPAALVSRRGEEGLRCVVDHELVHVRRGDVGSRLLFACAAVLLWPHPLFWFLRSRALLAAELIADDAAAGERGRRAYARTLMSLAEELHALKPAPGLVPGTYRHPTELTRRIEMLISKHDRLATRWSPARRTAHVVAAFAAVALCAFAFGVRPGVAEAPPAPATLTPQTADRQQSQAQQQSQSEQQSQAQSQSRNRQQSQGRQQSRNEQQSQAQQQSQNEQQPLVQPQSQNAQQSPIQPQSQNAQQSQERQQPQGGQRRDAQSQQQLRDLQYGGQLQLPQESDPGYAATLALAERAITMRSALEGGALDLRELEQRVQTGMAQESEAVRARLELQTVEQQLGAVMILLDAEIQAIQLEMAGIEKQIQAGQLGTSGRAEQIRLQGRLRVLQSVR